MELKMMTKCAALVAIASISILATGCSERLQEQTSIKKDITVTKSEDSDFVQTGYTNICNPNGSDTQLITLYDKKTGVEYIMLRNSDMTSIQPRTSSDGGILLHKAEEK